MKTNHRRGFRAQPHPGEDGRSPHRTTPYKGGRVFNGEARLAGKRFQARMDWDFSKGNRGMAKNARGAKKFVRSRVRFHENAAARSLARDT